MRSGLHAQGVGKADKILDYYRRSGSNCFKAVSARDNGLFDQLKELGVTIVYRVYVDRQDLGDKGFIKRVVDSAKTSPQIDFMEGYNEAFAIPGQLRKYAEFEIERMKALEAIGRKAAIGCFSQGTPEITDGGKAWSEFRPALEHALANGHALALHEYAGPYMQYGVETPDGKNQWKDGRFTGVTQDTRLFMDPRLEGWHTLRYRKLYKLLRTWGLGDLPLFITEGGIDDSLPRPGGQGAGYKDFAGTEWAKIPGVGDYASQRAWYMWQVSHDPYVRGVVDFGWEGTATGWPAFDLSTDTYMLERIIDEEADLPKGHFTSSPVPAPQPPPAPPVPPSSDRLDATLRSLLGTRYKDVRLTLPRHATKRYEALPPGQLTGIAVHHSAGPRNQTVEAIAKFHVDGNGWAGIGYHFVIREGIVHYVGDALTERAHVYGRNADLLGICITGNYTKESPNSADTTALRDLIHALDVYYGRLLLVRGHGDFAVEGHGTACPGAYKEIVLNIRSNAPTPPARPDFRKIVFAIESGMRQIEAEGFRAESSWIRQNYLADAIRRRDTGA